MNTSELEGDLTIDVVLPSRSQIRAVETREAAVGSLQCTVGSEEKRRVDHLRGLLGFQSLPFVNPAVSLVVSLLVCRDRGSWRAW